MRATAPVAARWRLRAASGCVAGMVLGGPALTAGGVPNGEATGVEVRDAPSGSDSGTALLPWRAGTVLAGRWRVERVVRHPEFLRIVASDGSHSAAVEVTWARPAADAWQTRHYRVQPAPDAPADPGLMAAVMSTLRGLESAEGHVPLVRPLARGMAFSGRPGTGVPPSSPARDPATWLLQAGWLLLAAAALPLAAACARTLGLPAWRGALVVVTPFALSLGLTMSRAAAPLHANGHAWREAREVMAPEGGCRGCSPYLHGRGGIAAQWTIVAVQHWVGRPADPLAGTTRVPVAAAGAGTALLVLVMTRRSGLALLAGVLFALAPLSRSLAVSGSSLAITTAALPWSLALALVALRSARLPLVAAAGVAAALASTSHTAALSWLPALLIAWPLAEPRERQPSFWLGLPWLVVPVVAWSMHLVSQAPLLAERNAGGAFLGQLIGSWRESVLLDPRWTAPALPVLAAGSALVAVLSWARSSRLATLAALLVASPPFLTPNACLSDAVRYQACLLPLIVALASDCVGTAGRWLGNVLHARPLVPQALLASACLVPFGSPPSADLATFEHEFVSAVVGQVPSPAQIVLPPRRDRRVRHDFPDFLLPRGVSVVSADEEAGPGVAPRFVYAGVACASWPRDPSPTAVRDPTRLRPECRELIAGAAAWRTFVLQPADLPPRTYHEVATGVRLGFFRLPSGAASAAPE